MLEYQKIMDQLTPIGEKVGEYMRNEIDTTIYLVFHTTLLVLL